MKIINKIIGSIINGVDYKSGESGVDAKTENLITIDIEHSKLHDGDHYLLSGFIDLALNEVFDLQFTTPDTTKWIHLTFVLDSENELEWHIYEGVTISTPGAAVTPRNNNRNSANTSGNTIKSQLNTSVANANSDTAVAGAIDLKSGICGSGRSAGIVTRGRELILKQNTNYCFRGIATVAGNMTYDMSWYEHTSKN